MIIKESEMLERMKSAKNVLLIEPKYTSKYPPLGLAKIKTFLNQNGVKSTFSRGMIHLKFDLICITTLFTYYSKQVFDVIESVGIINSDTPIIIGGIMASMVPEVFQKYKNVSVFTGYSRILDQCIPDDKILVREDPIFNDFSMVFTSRGCVNRCPYCMVWKIEKDIWINDKWKDMIIPNRPNLMILDNNLSAISFEQLKEIIDYSVINKKKILFENGLDCKHITKEMADELARVRFVRNGMRLAFDRIEEDGVFQKAIEMLFESGVSKGNFMIYVLFNFTDRPHDADYRARECARLGVHPYPQYYRPLKILSKNEVHVGKHWTLNLGRLFRNFWLMRGLWSKMSFDEYIHNHSDTQRFHITKEDIRVWENNGADKIQIKRIRKIS